MLHRAYAILCELAAAPNATIAVRLAHILCCTQNIVTDSRDSSFGHLAARNMVQVTAGATAKPATAALVAATAAAPAGQATR